MLHIFVGTKFMTIPMYRLFYKCLYKEVVRAKLLKRFLLAYHHRRYQQLYKLRY